MSTFAQLVGERIDGQIQVNATGAATQHAIETAQGQLDFYMWSATVHAAMQQGTAMYAQIPQAPEMSENLRAVFAFPLGLYHMVTYADSGIDQLSDAEGKRVFLGPPGGGATVIMTQIMEAVTGHEAGRGLHLGAARLGGCPAVLPGWPHRPLHQPVHPAEPGHRADRHRQSDPAARPVGGGHGEARRAGDPQPSRRRHRRDTSGRLWRQPAQRGAGPHAGLNRRCRHRRPHGRRCRLRDHQGLLGRGGSDPRTDPLAARDLAGKRLPGSQPAAPSRRRALLSRGRAGHSRAPCRP
jgi:hypothetical protein